MESENFFNCVVGTSIKLCNTLPIPELYILLQLTYYVNYVFSSVSVVIYDLLLTNFRDLWSFLKFKSVFKL